MPILQASASGFPHGCHGKSHCTSRVVIILSVWLGHGALIGPSGYCRVHVLELLVLFEIDGKGPRAFKIWGYHRQANKLPIIRSGTCVMRLFYQRQSLFSPISSGTGIRISIYCRYARPRASNKVLIYRLIKFINYTFLGEKEIKLRR